MVKNKTRGTWGIAVPAVVFLSACNGSGSEGTGVFQASIPQITDDFGTFASSGQTFTSEARLLQSTGSAGGTVTLDITVRPATDGSGDLFVSWPGQPEVRLARNASTGQYAYTDSTRSLFAQAALGRDAGTVLLVAEGGGLVSAGFVLTGRPSSDVAAQSGKAIYLGPSAFLAVGQDGAVNGGSGGVILEADFDTATVDGVIALTDSTSQTGFALGFADAPISGNGFSSSDLQQQGLKGTVTASSLNATFNGAGAGEVGGVYNVDLDTGAFATALGGAFIGARQAGDLAAVAASGGTVALPNGEQIVLGSGSVIGGSGSVYPDGSSSYYNSNTGVSFGADGGGCYYVGDWSNC